MNVSFFVRRKRPDDQNLNAIKCIALKQWARFFNTPVSEERMSTGIKLTLAADHDDDEDTFYVVHELVKG